MPKLSLGLDFGTNSVRALLVDVSNGAELATSVYDYPSGVDGLLLDPKDPNLTRQNPDDYVEGIYAVCSAVLRGVDPADVIGIGVDTTGSSPIPVDREGLPLSFKPEFKDNLAAYCWLWRDHTSYGEAAEITAKAREQRQPYLARCGGVYSSEWFWSKILHCLRTSPEVFEAAYSWVECCDWVVGFLTGDQDPLRLKRSVCAAGHKAMYAPDWGGLPSKEFLSTLDPRLADLRDRLYETAYASNVLAGGLSSEVAAKTGLRAGTPVAVGAFDAHFGAVASGARPGVLVKIIGTSTCDCITYYSDEPLADIPGVCGIVQDSIVPGYFGIEAGQSAVGDIFNWVAKLTGRSHEELTEGALRLKPGESGLVALDWNNGNRTVLVDPLLTGLLVGQTLHTTPAEIYRAAIEATAFGALTIIKRMEEYDVLVDELVNCGGIAEKSPLVMQIYADVIGRPMKVSRSAQTCALGSAIFGAVVGGAYPNVEAAQEAMTGTQEQGYQPDPAAHAVYGQLYGIYMSLHDAFGTEEWRGNLAFLMKELIELRERVRGV
jgi:L-ribulokinase